jgi:hypothetical protein
MNCVDCGAGSVDHWGIYPHGGSIKADTCKGYRKAKDEEAPAAPPSTSEGTETHSSPADVTGSPVGGA